MVCDITRCCHSLSECLVCFTPKRICSTACWFCRVESFWSPAGNGRQWSRLACPALDWAYEATAAPPRKGVERERGEGRGEAHCTGTDCSRTEADQYLVDSRSFHPCDHGKRNLAPSVTTTRISLPLNGLRSTRCGHYRQVAATAAILVEIKSPLE